MLRIRILLVLITFLTLWAGIRPATAWACSCIPPGPPSAELDGATAVFSGEVIQIEGSADPVRVTLQVDTVWKGLQHTTLTVTTARDSASCGYGFKEGESYLVYATGVEDGLQVSLCSRTQHLSSAQEDLTALGEGQPVSNETDAASHPADNGLSPVTWVVIASVALVLITAGAWVVTHRSQVLGR